jgi:predicted metallo-beta-lactamase superfamily hydrolase
MEIIPIAFDSIGTRSMCTSIETADTRILIDPSVSLAPSRYGLPPHPLELERMEEHWNRILQFSEKAEILIITHYHFDHFSLEEPSQFKNKVVFIKHPAEKINFSQKGRAALFLDQISGYPRKLEYADGKTVKFGKTVIKFSPPVFHGTNSKLGYVIEVAISSEGEKILFTSDVEGPSIKDQADFILKEKPNILIVDGPMTYMLGYRYSYASLTESVQNLVKIINFMRDLNYRTRIEPVYEAAKDKDVKVVSAAEYLNKPIELLEALRKKLYEEKNS